MNVFRSPVTSDARRPPLWLTVSIVAVYTSLFFFFLKNPKNSIQADSGLYLKLAYNLTHHHTFSSSDTPPFVPELYRLPAYPFFLAALTATSPSAIAPVVAIQCLLGVILVFFIWPVFYRYGGRRGAVWGAIFLCFDWVAFWHQDLILTEALFTAMLTGAVCVSIRYLESSDRRHAFVAAFGYGIAALIKPIGVLLAVIFLVSTFRRWKSTLLLVILTLFLPASWVVRNWILTGHPVYTIQGGQLLFECQAVCALAMDTGLTRPQALGILLEEMRKEGALSSRDPVIQSLAYQKKAIQIMKLHPLATLRYNMLGVVRLLAGTGLELILDQLEIKRAGDALPTSELVISGGGTLGSLKTYPALWLVQATYTLFLAGGYCLFGFGIWKLARRGKVRLCFFLIVSAGVIVAVSAHQGFYRLRIPMLPFLAAGIAACFGPSREKNPA